MHHLSDHRVGHIAIGVLPRHHGRGQDERHRNTDRNAGDRDMPNAAILRRMILLVGFHSVRVRSRHDSGGGQL